VCGLAFGWIIVHVIEWCHTYKHFTSHSFMGLSVYGLKFGHVEHVKESCHTYAWDTSHMWQCDVAHINESNHRYT